MCSEDQRTRRSVIRFVGATTIGALLAGCGGPGGDENDGDEDEAAAGDWEDVDTIELEAESNVWIGRSPEAIAGEENPALELYGGREYELTWTNTGEEYHNFVLHSSDEEVENLEQDLEDDERLEVTELLEDEGASLDVTFEATEEMEGYLCEVHPMEMEGDVTVRDEDEGESDADDEGTD